MARTPTHETKALPGPAENKARKPARPADAPPTDAGAPSEGDAAPPPAPAPPSTARNGFIAPSETE